MRRLSESSAACRLPSVARRPPRSAATEYHLGQLKARLAKLRTQLIEGSKRSGGPGEGFDVAKSGDARVALIGFPSVGTHLVWPGPTSRTAEHRSVRLIAPCSPAPPTPFVPPGRQVFAAVHPYGHAL